MGTKFEFKCTSGYDCTSNVKISYETDAETLSDILEDFAAFLRGCGFHFEGYLDFINDDYLNEKDTDNDKDEEPWVY